MPQKKKRVVETFKRSVETLKTRLPAYPPTLLPGPWKHGLKLCFHGAGKRVSG